MLSANNQSPKKSEVRTNAAIYARVSTDRQELANQLSELRAYCVRQGWPIVQQYDDLDVSGDAEERPGLEAALDGARLKRFDILVFWSLDRVSRGGTKETLDILYQLQGWGCDYISHQERYIDSIGPFKDVVISIIATLAKLEKERIRDRIKSAVRKVDGKPTRSSKGNLWGQHGIPPEVRAHIIMLHQGDANNPGLGVRAIHRMGIIYRGKDGTARHVSLGMISQIIREGCSKVVSEKSDVCINTQDEKTDVQKTDDI